MKFLISLLISTLLVSCEDSLQGDGDTVVDTRPITGEQTYSDIKFRGIKKILNITGETLTVEWESVSGAIAYQLFSLNNGELEMIAAVGANNTTMYVTGLTPLTQYSLVLKIMDAKGLLDDNQNIQSVTTTQTSAFQSNTYLELDESNINLGDASRLINNNSFTVSIKAKTSQRQPAYNNGDDARLISFHTTDSQQSMVNIFFKNNKVGVGYTNNSGQYKRVNFKNFNYNDNKWHSYVITYGSGALRLYVDKLFIKAVNVQLLNPGNHDASVGSFSGSGSLQRSFVGAVDELSIWNQELNQNEINALDDNLDLSNHSKAVAITRWIRMGEENKSAANSYDSITGELYPNNDIDIYDYITFK